MQTEMEALKSFVLEHFFNRKQNVNLTGGYPPNTEYGSAKKKLVQSLLEQNRTFK